jgi:beta-glucosidase
MVNFTLKNTGTRAGTEIAEVYAALPATANEPPKRLVGWARIALNPGESKQIAVPVDRDRLTIFDVAHHDWTLVPGQYTILVGGSSRDLPLNGPLTPR